jgi:hypothetical protein
MVLEQVLGQVLGQVLELCPLSDLDSCNYLGRRMGRSTVQLLLQAQAALFQTQQTAPEQQWGLVLGLQWVLAEAGPVLVPL